MFFNMSRFNVSLDWVGVFTAFHNKGLGIFTQFSGQLG